MRYNSLVAFCLYSYVVALPIKREVPQEHSHEPILTSVRASLNLNNPDGIVDPVFALLGDAAAAAGAGKITNLDCLQQATADQAFTNAQAAGDVEGMTNALIFRALERNTGQVGLASVLCNETATNPEIAAISQHQDPASSGAAATNKAIALELAKQIASIGGDPQDAIKSGTFAPGNIGDPTAKGNTCDDANDPNGCIFTQNLLVPDVTADEIDSAVAGIAASSAVAVATSVPAATAPVDTTGTCTSLATVTITVGDIEPTSSPTIVVSAVTATATASTSTASTSTANTSSGANLQTFTGALGGISPPAVTASGSSFVVANNDNFVTLAAALGRSCDVQHNECADAANSGGGFSVGDSSGLGHRAAGPDGLKDTPLTDASACADACTITIGDYNIDNMGPDSIHLPAVAEHRDSSAHIWDDANVILSTLSVPISNISGLNYDFTEVISQNDQDGGVPGGSIRPAYPYNSKKVKLVNGSPVGGLSNAAEPTRGRDGKLTLASREVPWNVGPKPLVAAWETTNGGRFFTMNVHDASKSDDSSSMQGDPRPPINSDVDQRTLQVETIATKIRQIKLETRSFGKHHHR
ncbi:hypothetical protein NM688_g6749 [Phlebia brevispora]|uniref:Uncharacterized protein n=1 Tax=Phlebia brevispora TaxID=194682 RepID=A0ACC1SCZ5_9APHY|nr:hypothetical protein NM688_g6749 [Phlebia brevispora]